MRPQYLSTLIPLALVGAFIGLGMYLHHKYPPKPYVPPTFENEEERKFWEQCVAEFSNNMGRGDEFGRWEGDHYIPPNRPSIQDAWKYADEMLYARRRRMRHENTSIINNPSDTASEASLV